MLEMESFGSKLHPVTFSIPLFFFSFFFACFFYITSQSFLELKPEAEFHIWIGYVHKRQP